MLNIKTKVACRQKRKRKRKNDRKGENTGRQRMQHRLVKPNDNRTTFIWKHPAYFSSYILKSRIAAMQGSKMPRAKSALHNYSLLYPLDSIEIPASILIIHITFLDLLN